MIGWVLLKAFFASIEIIIWFLFFTLLLWCITLIDLWILKIPYIPGIKHIWSWYMVFFNVVDFCLLQFCWGFLHLCSSVILACSFPFLWHLHLVLVLGWWWPHRMSLAIYLPLQFSGLSNTIHKNKLKMDSRSKCKTRNYKTPRGKYKQNTLWHKSQPDPLRPISQSNGNKSKNKQMGPN